VGEADGIVLPLLSMLLRLDMPLRRQDQHIVKQLLDLMLVEEPCRQLNNSPTLLGLYRQCDTFSILAIIMNLPNTRHSRPLAISQVPTPATTTRKKKNMSRTGSGVRMGIRGKHPRVGGERRQKMGICHIGLQRMIGRPSQMAVRKKAVRVKGSSMAEHWMGGLLPEGRRRRREKDTSGWDWVYNPRRDREERVEIRWRVMMMETEVYLPLHHMAADEMDTRDHRRPHNYFEPSHPVYHPVQCH
jgi:hypothetical protein